MTNPVEIPLTNPRALVERDRIEIQTAIDRVINSGTYILGSEVESCEWEFAQFLGSSFAVGVSSGTDAITLALKALGIGPGDEVITVSHTAVATVAGIVQSGATPVFVDIEPGYMTMDPTQLPAALTPKTRAVLPVHLYGQAADLDRIMHFCKTNHLALIEDASQAHGATYKDQHLGTFGDIAIFSCYPTKNLGALGDAGVAVTDDDQLARNLRNLREYGWEQRNYSRNSGQNARLDEIQAAVLRVKLTKLPSDNAARRNLADQYATMLVGGSVQFQTQRDCAMHVFHLLSVTADRRDSLRASLDQYGIQTAIHYPHPVHLQPAYAKYHDRICSAPLPVTEVAALNSLSLPLHPLLHSVDVTKVCQIVNQLR